jgi:hypothetical protein
MDAALRHMHADASRVFLEVDESNQAAIALYRRLGFAEVGRRPAYYAQETGRIRNALIMRRDLWRRAPPPRQGNCRDRLIARVLALAIFAIGTALGALMHLRPQDRMIGEDHARALAPLILRLLAMKVHVTGAPSTDRPLLIVSNHVSWTDVMVIGSVGDVHFIARGDMAHWPVMGTIGRLQRTSSSSVVAPPRRPSRRPRSPRPRAGKVLVLFAEGTTGDGNTVLPFKTSLFAALGRSQSDEASPSPRCSRFRSPMCDRTARRSSSRPMAAR